MRDPNFAARRRESVRKEKESEGTGWSMEGGSLSGGGIGTYSYVTLVQWNIFDEKPIFCDDLSLPSHTIGKARKLIPP
jgi:hypothetical protein